MQDPVLQIQSLLKRRIGSDPDILDHRSLFRIVKRRMAACGLVDPGRYWSLLQQVPWELDELIELVAVPETWFFRDDEPFALLTGHLRRQRAEGRVSFRILSAPCSTGEEPYSIAMALLGAGFEARTFRVDAVDIGRESLALARQAVYGQNAFRSRDLSFRDRFFDRIDAGYALRVEPRNRVRFIRGNLIDGIFRGDQSRYDAVFCRNMLIYLHREARLKVLDAMREALRPKGLLFVGATEAAQVSAEYFTPMDHARSFAFRKEPAPRRVPLRPEVAKKVLKPRSKLPPAFATRRKVAVSVAPPESSSIELLEQARLLADRGSLAKARALCVRHLQDNRDDAQGHFLLGLVHQALDDRDQAELCFNRAVYLVPGHIEALTHLALLAEERGDRSGADTLRQRLERMQGGKAGL